MLRKYFLLCILFLVGLLMCFAQLGDNCVGRGKICSVPNYTSTLTFGRCGRRTGVFHDSFEPTIDFELDPRTDGVHEISRSIDSGINGQSTITSFF